LNFKLQHVRIKFFLFLNFNQSFIGTWDFIEIYCLRQCSPLLGDQKYSNRVKLVAGVPMYINPIKFDIHPAKQVKQNQFDFSKRILFVSN
jgi:hypothetical protein